MSNIIRVLRGGAPSGGLRMMMRVRRDRNRLHPSHVLVLVCLLQAGPLRESPCVERSRLE
jgi:hypothetical protein